jgi:hypothetical protein
VDVDLFSQEGRVVPLFKNHDESQQIGWALLNRHGGQIRAHVTVTSLDPFFDLDGWPMLSIGGYWSDKILMITEISICTHGACEDAYALGPSFEVPDL